jgi:hypothetical protein
MGRATNRAGYSNLSGAANPRIVYSETAPVNPKTKDIWINTSSIDQSKYRYNGTVWVAVASESIKDQYGDTNVPKKIWTGLVSEYEAIVTKDDNTLYFQIAD